VASTDSNDVKASSSWYTAAYQVHIATPGVDVLTTNIWPFSGGYITQRGTSFAAAYASGMIALVKSAAPNLPNAETALFKTAEKVGGYVYDYIDTIGSRSRQLGYGRINAHKALSMANGDPRVPQNFSANISYMEYNSHPRISWLRDPSHPQDVDVEQYQIWRRIISSSNPWQNPPWALLTTVGNSPTSYIDYSINYAGGGPNTVRYRIKAIDAAGLQSGFTDSVGVNFGNAYKPAVEEQGTPIVFELSQNYPNPFNPTTKLSYSIPEDGLITLKVFDVLGREVLVLANEWKPAGSYTVEFDGSNLTSGVYYYQLQHNGKTLIGKMLLAK
jgi:subtilisin family serine protease